MIELRAIFKGKVQGVGFRWTVVDKAEEYRIVGTVKNLKNGTVEVVAQGTQEVLEQFIEAIKRDAGAARIETVECKYLPPAQSYANFKIV